ncbi:recombinase family protein [uncultured Roseobacter sp.]|uniref:recombinase family protein n=1 Tax=uncultured Roseobacter sp. TaxID=114847 RepID=UPI00262D5E89|nr:recombinase family protein [uncultured Roseobacter sp.]
MKGQPPFERAIEALGAGDIFLIIEQHKAKRSLIGRIHITTRIADRGTYVKVLDKPWLDLTTPMGKGILAFLSTLAEDERERITRRAQGLCCRGLKRRQIWLQTHVT